MFIKNFNNNCGDYWSSPQFYFSDFKDYPTTELKNVDQNTNLKNFVILGGGPLGVKSIMDKILLLKTNNQIKLICWGVGFNEFDFLKLGKLITTIDQLKKVKENYFKDFDLIGLRDADIKKFKYFWVPCTSCLNPYFIKFHKTSSIKKIGVYYHHDLKFFVNGVLDEDYLSNEGTDIEEKIEFISRYEYIITNSYHGVYWAQLLKKKVICLPFKSSLFRFPTPPIFLRYDNFKLIIDKKSNKQTFKIKDDVFEQCIVDPDFLDKSIVANYDFYKKVKEII